MESAWQCCLTYRYGVRFVLTLYLINFRSRFHLKFMCVLCVLSKLYKLL